MCLKLLSYIYVISFGLQLLMSLSHVECEFSLLSNNQLNLLSHLQLFAASLGRASRLTAKAHRTVCASFTCQETILDRRSYLKTMK